jgi:hypothetical protein
LSTDCKYIEWHMSQFSVNKCKSCNQWYCMECCDHEEWRDFCSIACAKDYADELEAEAIDSLHLPLEDAKKQS